MALALALDRRAHERRRILGSFDSRLLSLDGRIHIPCRPIDVSVYGLGISTDVDIEKIGKTFVLIIAGHEIELELIWSKKNSGQGVGYRSGFRVSDPGVDLDLLFKPYQ